MTDSTCPSDAGSPATPQNETGAFPASRVRQVEAIDNGTVIDHIPAELTLTVANLLGQPDDLMSIGINLRSARLGRKGVVKIANRELDADLLSRLALIAPGASVAIIRDYEVQAKHTVPAPTRIDAIARCANPNCVTSHEKWPTRFDVIAKEPLIVRCVYCERSFAARELTLI